MLFLRCSTFYQHGLWSLNAQVTPVWTDPDYKQILKEEIPSHRTLNCAFYNVFLTESVQGTV